MTLKLRPDLEIRVVDDGALVIDPITHRRFHFAEVQAAVLSGFRAGDDHETIAAEVLGSKNASAEISAFADRLREIGLTQDVASNRTELAIRQAKAQRGRTGRDRDRRVGEAVRWAAREIPFYRDRLAGLVDDIQSVDDLARLPTTSKADVRDNFPKRLLKEGLDLGELLKSEEISLRTTSGSTGGRLEFLYDNGRHASGAMARQHDLGTLSRVAVFTTPICNGAVCHRGGVAYEDRVWHDQSLTLNSSERVMEMRREHLDDILGDLERFKPNSLIVDPVYGVALVRALERFELSVPQFDLVVCGFEFLSTVHRDILSRAFGAKVHVNYGATDLGGTAAVSCGNDILHVKNDEFAIEFVREGRVCAPGEVGELTVTMLKHRFTRLVRYRVGDLGTPVGDCECAFGDWTGFHFEGRLSELLVSDKGEPVTTRAVDQLFVGLHWIDFFMLTQVAESRFQLMAVRRPERDEGADEATFLDRARELLGDDAEIQIRYVRALPVNPSLKYPLTRCKIPTPWAEW